MFWKALKNRLKEPSTYAAIGAILIGVPPEAVSLAADLPVDTVGVVAAAAGVLLGEKK